MAIAPVLVHWSSTIQAGDSGYWSCNICVICHTWRCNTENSTFKLYIRNFINISSFHNLLDVIYTEISGTMKQFTVGIGMQRDRLLFDKIDNCALNPSVSDSGLVVNAFGY